MLYHFFCLAVTASNAECRYQDSGGLFGELSGDAMTSQGS
ncbi:hypothetical protein, unlikely [Trypanosoma brucei brucei TREU927]|uniref:Uncharacterized protein n=1 Tax=Trypanosoma brucei brucei (strain 927/4 GUTat10.1) TaxID=185431 RepID=Q4GZ16_TRYB2|nr:hypothetical protein, unlikely [Trypanosoma brucei brucei TREU927]CAJ16266.1 hypothetical protein, unlikely [Trypanosoma brucei brucei TREU927]